MGEAQKNRKREKKRNSHVVRNILQDPLISPYFTEYTRDFPVDKVHVIYGARELLRDQIRLFINKMRRDTRTYHLEITFQEARDIEKDKHDYYVVLYIEHQVATGYTVVCFNEMPHDFLHFTQMFTPLRCYPQCAEAFSHIEGFMNPDANCCPLHAHLRKDFEYGCSDNK